ncbi:MAG: small subunit ribosomal protein S6 [Microgenomates group bacterium LiPW_16]|nr:MAG: small subunit ribosomal protein S6 [Microgenomates group bacterium LiPW_16]
MINTFPFVMIITMRSYELTLILNAGLDKSSQEKVLTKIKKIIDDSGGKMGKVEEWGKRQLSYPIKKQKEGVYLLLTLELEGKEAKKIEEKLKLEESVLRHLLIRKE